MASLITGFPSLVARELLSELRRRHPDEDVHLIALPELFERAQAVIPANDAKVTLHRGDVAALDLGLSADARASVLASTRRVFHFAALRHPSAGAKRIRAINLEAARNVLRFLQDGRGAARLIHLSTLFVLGEGVGKRNAEAPVEGHAKHRNPLEAVHAEVESMIMGSGFGWTLLRPGLVIGDSKTGEVDRLGGVYRLGILAASLPRRLPLICPPSDARLHFVAADTVAKAALALADTPESLGRIVAIDAPNPLPTAALVKAVASALGRSTHAWPLHLDWLGRLAPVLMPASRSARELHYLNDRMRYEAPQSRALLSSLGVDFPDHAELLNRAISYTMMKAQAAENTAS